MTKFNILAGACATAAVLALGFLAAPDAEAQSKTLKIVVPYSPGSGPDILSRLMSEQIPHDGGPSVLVENRAGGGTLIGTEAAMRSDPDGSTVLLVANTFAINPPLKRGNYEIEKNFEPVCYLAATPMVLVVQSSSPWKTLKEPSGGPASSLHVSIEVLRLATKIDINYVPYGGSGPAINALLGGHVQAVWADYPTVVSQLASGTLRGLVTTSGKRVAQLPDVPTLTETGISNYQADIFYGIMAPAKTPPEALNSLAHSFSTALKAPDMAPKLAKQGLNPVGICGAEFGKFLKGMSADYARIIKEAGIKTN